MGAGTSKVAIEAADPLARAGLVALVGESVALDRADVVVWDLGPDVALARASIGRAAAFGVPVVALAPDGLPPRAALVGAVRAILGRPPTAEQLVAAIAAARSSLVALAPAFAAMLVGPATTNGAHATTSGARGEQPLDALTAREQDVLAGLAEGYSNRRIAQRLGISEATVKFHVNAILAKLDADSRTDAVVRAARRGLVMI